MGLIQETYDLIEVAIYSATIIFFGMLFLNAVSDLVIGFFGGDE